MVCMSLLLLRAIYHRIDPSQTQAHHVVYDYLDEDIIRCLQMVDMVAVGVGTHERVGSCVCDSLLDEIRMAVEDDIRSVKVIVFICANI